MTTVATVTLDTEKLEAAIQTMSNVAMTMYEQMGCDDSFNTWWKETYPENFAAVSYLRQLWVQSLELADVAKPKA